MKTEDLITFAIQTASLAGQELLENFKRNKYDKRNTPKKIKSKYDLVADQLIIKRISAAFPEHSILTEESGLDEKHSDYLWIVDPLDGTGNFENGNPMFAVSIALWHKGEPILGVIDAPALRERYVAVKKQGAYLCDTEKGQKFAVKVSNVTEIKQSYLVFCDGGEQNLSKVLNFLSEMYPKAKDMRKMGSAAIELAWVGTGRCEAYITPRISIWDIAAGILFVKEAGGELLNFNMEKQNYEDLLNQKEIMLVASNKHIKLPKI